MNVPAGYTLRDFALADFDAALALWRASEGVGLNESDTRPAIAAYLARNPGLSLVATDAAGALVGTLLCGHDGRRGYLNHLAVAAAHRRHGLGRTLVATALDRLRILGIPKCNLMLYATNAAGRVFWERCGWSAREDLVLIQRPLR